MRWIPFDPPWLIVPVVAGILLSAASVWNENWSVLVFWTGGVLSITCGTIGLDRWYEQRHPGGKLR
jgi:hypothetical protein